MESIKKYKKILIALICILAIIALPKVSSAFTVDSSNMWYGYPGTSTFQPNKPLGDNGGIFYCIQHGVPYRGTIDTIKYSPGDTSGSWCNTCVYNGAEKPVKPWDFKYSMEYTDAGKVDISNYQDTAYVIARAAAAGKLLDPTTQYSIWATSINAGKADSNKGAWGEEAVAYKVFYDKIHNGTTDIYSQIIRDDTAISNVTVQVDQANKTYIVGPFKVNYPKGEYVREDGSQKWSYITNIKLLDQANKIVGDVKSNTIHIIDINGNELRDSINNNNFPNSDDEFYVKFSSTLGDINNIKLDVDFEYLESISVTLTKYTGTLYVWTWGEVYQNKTCTEKGCLGSLCTWKLSKDTGTSPQQIIAYKGTVSKNYSTANLKMAPGGIPLTMKISGQTFLDDNEGKITAGNNKMDAGEVLPGAEVVLFEKVIDETGKVNIKVVTKTSELTKYHTHTAACYSDVAHVHTGDPYTGGGCYTTLIHEHDGNLIDGGACYAEKVTHVHTGSPEKGDGCYTVPIYHKHTDACYSEVKHVHEGNTEEGGPCYAWTGPYCGACTTESQGWGHPAQYCPGCGREHTHELCSGEYWKLSCNKDTSRELICGYAEGDIERYDLGCGRNEEDGFCYELTCTEPLYGLGCKNPGGTKVLTCKKSNTIEDTITKTLLNPVITDKNGYYEFDGLSAFDEKGNPKKYFVKFVYDGMKYTNVNYDSLNGDITSKAVEVVSDYSQDVAGKNNWRAELNNRFKEIRSYPSNYSIIEETDPKKFEYGLGAYNKVFPQEEIIEIFKKISEKMEGTGTENYVIANALTNTYEEFIKNNSNAYKDNASKEELKRKIKFAQNCRVASYTVQNYPLTDKFVISDTGKTIGNVWYSPIYSGAHNQLHVNLGIKARPTFDLNLKKDVFKADVSVNGKTETYTFDSRKESTDAIFNFGVNEADYKKGINAAYKNTARYEELLNQIREKRTRALEEDKYDLNMRSEEIANAKSSNYNSVATGKVDSNYKTYDDKDYELTDSDRLKILVTYKLEITNESNSIGAVTEIVDYFDPNYEFVGAYLGNSKGPTNVEVPHDVKSIYGNEYTSKNGAYKTVYLRPEETRLYRQDGTANDIQYIYVVLELKGDGDAGKLLTKKLLEDNSTLNTMNIAEINGYKTYESINANNTKSPGLIDIDSNPGNFNISNITALTQEKVGNYSSSYEDDASSAPAFVYKAYNSRTIEGKVFEDATGKASNKVYTNEDRTGNGKIDSTDKGIQGVLVELVEIKDGQMIVRATTRTNDQGWYGFTGFVAGDYVIRYTYGADDDTALTTSSVFNKGKNETSYNGQDYQATYYRLDDNEIKTPADYKTDANLMTRYNKNDEDRIDGESPATITEKTSIYKYEKTGYYWYTVNDNKSDAKDYAHRVAQVEDYSRKQYGKEIVNHKAEVFNAYVNPQPEHITKDVNNLLAKELERRTYRYAYTPLMEIEVEYATQTTTGTTSNEHKITGVDFGIVERPKSELTIDQDVAHIKVTAADGTILFDTDKETDNLQWINNGDIKIYDKNEQINIMIDEELISGAKLEVIYDITVKNNGEKDVNATTRAKNIINYVANNFNYDELDNMSGENPLWTVVSKDIVQTASNSTFINNNNKVVDLSTQSVILQATENNPLTKSLKPGEQVTAQLKLKKVLSAESSMDDLTYTNMTEIIEIENTVGRYDHGAIPGNQKLDLQPQEHDTSGASKYVSFKDGNIDPNHPQDGTIIVTPPPGSTYIYYVIGITSAAVLAVGVYLIKKFVIDKRK